MSYASENSLSPYLLAVMSEEYLRMRCCSGEDNDTSSSYPERSIKVSSLSNEHEQDDEFEKSSETKSTTESSADEVLSSRNLTKKKAPRTKYTDDQQEEIIGIYKRHPCPDDAMKEIKAIPEYKSVQKRKVIRWIKSINNKAKMGRPIDPEFEREVLVEVKENWKPNMGSFNAFVTKSATTVFNRKYWSEEEQAFCLQKWKEAKGTRRLKFTTRWIEGWIRRAMQHGNSGADKNPSGTDSDQSSSTSSANKSSGRIGPLLLLSAHR